jgi:hypothetical protein
MQTPYFPVWRPRLAALGARVRALREQNLFFLESLFAAYLPLGLLAQSDAGRNSRDRVYSIRRTFWCFLWQVLNPACPCREVVRRLQAQFALHDAGTIDTGTGAYCQARKRLPFDRLPRARVAVAAWAERTATRWHGLRVKVLDGTTVSLPDTRSLQRVYPQPSGQKPGCGFPLLKLVGVFSLATGVLLDYAKGNKHQHELSLLQQLLDQFGPGDVALADRGFNCFVLLALLLLRGVGSVMRLHQARSTDLRQGRRLGRNDRLVVWRKPQQKPHYLPLGVWRLIPDELPVRLLRFSLRRKGFRPDSVTLVTTLIDAKQYPAEEIAWLYVRRWHIELWFRDLKTSMRMEVLRCKSPALVHKELEMFFIAYNLIRGLMQEASVAHDQPLERISFKGSVDATRHFSAVIAQARSKRKQALLTARLLEILADDELPDRPGRREPRALKRRPKPFPWLTAPRHEYQEILHRNDYYLKKNHLQKNRQRASQFRALN